jgi:kumamolisin
MPMRHSAVSFEIAAVLIACWANIALGQSSVTIPPSSIANPSDAGVRLHTNVQVRSFTTRSRQPNGGPPYAGYFYEDPASLACIYDLISTFDGACNPNDPRLNNPNGGSRAIAVVDAYDYPNAAGDLAAFSAQFDVPPPSNFSVIYAQAGGGQCTTATGTQPAQDPTGGWEVEESLDIEYAHAMAPNATLYLVEAQSNSDADLFCAVGVASNLVAKSGGGEVSMSFGSGEFSGETSFDSVFTTPKVVYFASSGDSPGVSYPAASPNVVSVGGTSTGRNPVSGSFLVESNWQIAGGGPSGIEPRPAYQNSIAGVVGGARGTPDVALDANPYTGVWVLDNFVVPELGTTLCGGTPCWLIVGGTSVASPVFAGIVNAAGNFFSSSSAELNRLYGGLGFGFNNIKVGSCGPYMGYITTNTWDFCTGLGSPKSYLNK